MNGQVRGKANEVLTSILMHSKGKGHTRKRGWLDVFTVTHNLSGIQRYGGNVLLCCDLRKPFSDLKLRLNFQCRALNVEPLYPTGSSSA